MFFVAGPRRAGKQWFSSSQQLDHGFPEWNIVVVFHGRTKEGRKWMQEYQSVQGQLTEQTVRAADVEICPTSSISG